MSVSRRMTTRSRSTVLLGVMLFFGSAYFYQDPEWNGNSRLGLTRAIVEQGTLKIDDYHAAPGWVTGDKAFFNGHFYSDKAIGSSLMAVPFYFLLYRASQILAIGLSADVVKHVLTTAVMGTTFTLCGLCMYDIARRITGDPWRAALPAVFISFGTMLWPYSAVFYGHVPAAAFLMLTFALLFAAKESTASGTRRAWFWIGMSVSLAFLSDHTVSVVLPGLAAYALYALRGLNWNGKLKTAWHAVPGLVLPLLFFFAYNLAVFGKPIAFGYSYEVEERFQGIMSTGIMGIRLPTLGATYHISLDPRFGLFWLSPVLLLAPAGYIAAIKNRRHLAEALLSIYAIAAIFYVNAASFLWYGGSTFGPRLLIPALPFFIVPLAILPAAWAIPMIGLGLISIANMLIPLLGQIQFSRLEFKPNKGGFFVADQPFRGFSLLYEYGIRKAVELSRSGNSPWTFGTAIGLPSWLSVVSLALTQTGLLLAFRKATSVQRSGE